MTEIIFFKYSVQDLLNPSVWTFAIKREWECGKQSTTTTTATATATATATTTTTTTTTKSLHLKTLWIFLKLPLY